MAARRGTTHGETEAASDGLGVNEVRLVGRVSGTPETRSLPSGDEVVQLRLVVRRPPDPAAQGAKAKGASAKEASDRGARAREASAQEARAKAVTARAAGDTGARASVDTIDVSCWTPMTRRAGLRMAHGDVVEVEGSLRRRFYRAGPSVQSRYDVVAARVRRAGSRA